MQNHNESTSAGALAALQKAGQQPGEFLARQGSGDWGELDGHDRKENQLSLERGLSATTLLLPEEYRAEPKPREKEKTK